jgi:hypothetical protein
MIERDSEFEMRRLRHNKNALKSMKDVEEIRSLENEN